MKKLTPTYHATNIYEIPTDFFKKNSITNILIDLDNTLASYRQDSADQRARDYVSALLAAGYNVVIVSNNRGRRVNTYAKSIGVEYRANMRKPLKFKFNRLLKEKNFTKRATVLIGDQLLTDIFVAARVGIRSILVDKLVEEDQWTTKINRRLERPFRRSLIRREKLVDWRKFYE